ncbi:hypothetical protein GcM3_160020 [Golovinomyces cichoracearum]|uniref:Uncharacterized protein n=1 Tax=Golovinomyces cichoracearum TaxID=62708 RepID=A0A420HU91_9PEZI|nr:hypothetical protein GcM3_160020 [Golovinomyces cichoracearum]
MPVLCIKQLHQVRDRLAIFFLFVAAHMVENGEESDSANAIPP